MAEPGKILVVDDDPTLTALLKHRLSAQGYEVDAAGEGLDGLEKFCVFQPDLILLDILMPNMDGHAFVLNFKKRGGDVRKTPIIILTCVETMQDVFAIEGINDYITKPFDMDHLISKINKRMRKKEKEILVVDDAPETVALIESSLSDRAYGVLTAANGLEALEVAKRSLPDLMILDVMMPKLDGYSVCRMLKFDDRYKNIAIILLTALNQDKDTRIGREVGADVCLSKPYNGGVLLENIKRLLWD